MSIKNKFKEELESIHKSLIEVSDWMYENPELGFEEYKTCLLYTSPSPRDS